MFKSKLVDLVDELASVDNQNDFSMVTYRTSKKTATMIELMSIISQKSVASLFTTMLSEKIASELFMDDSNIELLNEYLELKQSNSGFVKLLLDRGLIELKLSLFEIENSNEPDDIKELFKKLHSR